MQNTLERPENRTSRQSTSIGELVSNLPTDTLKSQARDIVKNILPKVNHDPLFHVWNELNAQSVNDPKAKYIVDMVNSRSFPLQAFAGKTIESFYGGGGSGGDGGGGTGSSGGSGETGGGSTSALERSSSY